jgi:hypothetical protein
MLKGPIHYHWFDILSSAKKSKTQGKFLDLMDLLHPLAGE